MKRFIQNSVFLLGFVLFFGYAIKLQRFQADQIRQEPEKFRDWLYLPSSDYVKWTTLGYDQITADTLWLRSIQSFGATYASKDTLPQLNAYFDVIIDLDPHFLTVYRFANLVIGEEAGDHEKGLAILEKGMANNPDNYLPAYDAAFFTYWVMDDPERAKYYTSRALERPDCPEFVRGWLGFFDKEMGRFIAAYQNYFSDYAKYHNSGDATLSRIRLLNLRRAIHEWTQAEIRKAALDFEARNGRTPTMRELEDSGVFTGVELPDWQALSKLIAAVEESGEKYPEKDEELHAISANFLHKGWTRLFNATSDNPNFPGYMLWPGQRPFVTPNGIENPVPNKYYVMSELDVAAEAMGFIGSVKLLVQNYKLENGSFPPDDSFLPPEAQAFTEPWGGKWDYDPATGTLRATGLPNLMELYRVAPRF